MLVGIYECTDPNGRYLPVLKAYEEILSCNRIPFVRLKISQPDFWEKVAGLDLFILRWGHYDSDRQKALALLPVIEKHLGVKCYPDWNTCWHYDDKIRQWLLLKPLGFPMVESHVFWDKNEALQWVEQAQFPLVFKLRTGAASSSVIQVKDRKHARKLVKRMFGKGIIPGRFFDPGSIRFKYFSPWRELRRMAGNFRRRWKGLDPSPWWQVEKNYVFFQDFLPGNDYDTRVTVIGDRAFAFRRFVRKADFRASGSGMIDHDPAEIDPRCVEIAFRVSKALRFQSMAYDFLFTRENEPRFCEISYTYLSSVVHACPGFWDPELNWHPGHFWPEYLHLVDALNLPELKAPELDY